MKDDERYPIPTQWLTKETTMLVDSVARWSEREVVSRRHEFGEDFEKLHRPALQNLMEQVGFQELFWPESEEMDVSAVTLAAALEQVGIADTGLGFLIANTAALQRCIPASLKSELGEKGSIGSLVLPGYGGIQNSGTQGPNAEAPSQFMNGLEPQIRAKATNKGWTLEGRAVRPQCHGAKAAYFGIVGEVDGQPALFAVKSSAKGLRTGGQILKTGMASSCNADLELRKVAVPKKQRLFSGFESYRELMSWYYMGCAASASGALLACHRILDNWCDFRVIKGRKQPFKDNPLVASLLGEIGGLIGTHRILVYHLAHLLDGAEEVSESVATTAVAITRSVVRASDNALDKAMELMASAGYATEWNLERYWRDSKTLSAYLMLETAGQMDLARHYFGCTNL